MTRIYVGIDPGLDGSMALIYPDGEIEFRDTPTLHVGKRRVYDIADMMKLVPSVTENVRVALEKVHAMPKNGTLSAFSLGQSMGIWETLLVSNELSYELVPPQTWKKSTMNGSPKEKDASRHIAMKMFPRSIPWLDRKKDHNRADALLMAEYLRIKYERRND